MRSRSVTCLVMLIVLGASADVAAQVCTPGAEREFGFAYQQRQLEEAGYRCDTASLVRALADSRQRIAGIAAGVLASRSPTPEVIAGLRRAVAAHQSDLVAIAAVRSLQALGVSGWEAAFVQRFRQMDDRDSRKLTAAGLLAQAGRTEGWPPIEGMLRGPLQRGSGNTRIAHAVRQAIYFHGLRDAGGRVIDAVAWADAVLARARAGGIPDLDAIESNVEIVKEQGAGTLPLDELELAAELGRRQQAGTSPR